MAQMLAPALLLHPVAQVGWTDWSIHWSTVIGLTVLGVLYTWRASRTADAPSGGQRLAFFAGLLVMFLSLNGPLHDLSDYYLFSAHMVQHLLITLIVPPLLIAGLTGGMLRPLVRLPVVGPVARAITAPIACFAIFNVTLMAWHLPPVYNAALAYHWVHILQHLMFMSAAVLMWWPTMSPMPELPRLSYPGQMLYCFLLSIPMSIVSVYIVYSRTVLYHAYASAPRVWGISPLDDQMIGGLIMWIPGGLFLFGVASVVFFKWASDESPHREPRVEAGTAVARK